LAIKSLGKARPNARHKLLVSELKIFELGNKKLGEG